MMENETNSMTTSRRNFLKLCGSVAAVLGVSQSSVVHALTTPSPPRPPVLWLHFAECTGCTESILRTTAPFFDDLIMNIISLDYHETLMAAAGHTVEDLLSEKAAEYEGQFFAVVEGAIPTAENGMYGMIGGRTMLSMAQEILPKANAVICCGTCSAYGGLPAAEPNPTGAMGVEDALPGLSVPVINVPGCPPNPVNFVAVIADYLLHNALPDLDEYGRPEFAYGQTIHRSCPMRNIKGACLKDEGCKGQWTQANCPTVKFNEGTSFPMQAGHPCIGCVTPGFWDENTAFYSSSRQKKKNKRK